MLAIGAIFFLLRFSFEDVSQATAILNCFLSPFDITSPVIECEPKTFGQIET